jgi:hypothetical protein
MPNIRKLIRRAIFVPAGIGLIAATAASAQAKDKGEGANVPAQKYVVTKGKDGTVKYCTTLPPITGSIIAQKICKTEQGWKEDGVTLNVG